MSGILVAAETVEEIRCSEFDEVYGETSGGRVWPTSSHATDCPRVKPRTYGLDMIPKMLDLGLV